MKKLYLFFLLLLMSVGGFAQTSTFSYSASVQTFTVPLGAGLVSVDLRGAKGGNYPGESTGGSGGRMQCTLSVTGGEVLYIYVGQVGTNGTDNGVVPPGGGDGGGGAGGGSGSSSDGGAAGGGSTDIRTISGSTAAALSSRLVVAAGGGGGGYDCGSETGGAGGGATGGGGIWCSSTEANGATLVGGGVGNYTTGSFGAGGNAESTGLGGGGGGGWYGGGGAEDGGGGGGSSYAAPGLTSGATTTSGYNSSGNGSAIIKVLCNPVGPIVGNVPVCPATPLTLSDPTSLAGGSWSSNNAAVALVNPTSGVVTGVITGVFAQTAVITYNVPQPSGDGCASPPTVVVTINPIPISIVGAPATCAGAINLYTESSTGGFWSSSNTSVATIDNSGNLHNLTIGPTTVAYTFYATGCSTLFPVTVNMAPSVITGTPAVCVGSSTHLIETVSGGGWLSGSGSVASVDGSGDAYGISAGTSNLTYTLTDGCSTSAQLTVNPLPTPYPVTAIGNTTFCAGSSNTAAIALAASQMGVTYNLFNGSTSVGSMTGSGLLLNFGVPIAVGTYSVSAVYPATGCAYNMTGSVTIAQKPSPVIYNVTQAGTSFCIGGTGVDVSLSGSSSGVSYQLLYNGASSGGARSGTGLSIDFGQQYSTGTYTVLATEAGAAPNCAATMSGSAVVTAYALPTVHNITGGGEFCPGGAGVAVGLDYADAGVSYQLIFPGIGNIGSPVLGSGDPLTFGLQTDIGSSYGVIATNVTTGCTNVMAGSADVSNAQVPAQYNITGGGSYCNGGAGDTIGLDNSDEGVNYQLYRGAIPVGTIIGGVYNSISFGAFTTPGDYTVVATDLTYGCTSQMNGSALISIIPLPASYNITGGGSFCTGGTGESVGLAGSASGVTYDLYNGGAQVGSLTGTGSALNFGNFTAPGSYTAIATSASGNCVSSMLGSAIITENPAPVAFNVIGGGSFCAGGEGVGVMLDLSTPGVNYQLLRNNIGTGTLLSGTGDTLFFGPQTLPGAYTVVGTLASGACSSNMTGSATVSINPLPAAHGVTGGGSYCAGGGGQPVGLAGSDATVTYQLYLNTVATGTSSGGTGGAISFGSQVVPGTYTVVATDSITGCSSSMPGAATLVANPAPAMYSVTGGGGYCSGTAAGVPVGLSNSNSGVNYVLYNGIAAVRTLAGSGGALDFGLISASGLYTIKATAVTSGCSSEMSGSASVAANPTPGSFSVVGGGSYCAGSLTSPTIGLNGSADGVNYQVYLDGSPIGVPTAGTGSILSFGAYSTAGNYTIVATDTGSGCAANMTGGATISINPRPASFTVTGGGGYCAGGSGAHVFLNVSNSGVEYSLYYAGYPLDTIAGTGAGLDFGAYTSAGEYTAVATNPVTGCTSNMLGNAAISINPLPALHNVIAANGGDYCATAAGVNVGIDGSDNGTSYQLYLGSAMSGGAVNGTGGSFYFGVRPAGNYTVIATNTATGCTSNMTGSAMVTAIPVPNVYATIGGGNYCSTGLGLHIGLSGSDSGTQYQLYHGTTAVGVAATGSAYGGPIDFGDFTMAGAYTIVATNGSSATGCTSDMSGEAVINVYPVAVPVAQLRATGGDTACFGNMLNLTASSINGGTAPVYNWMVNGITVSSGTSYSYLPTNGDRVTLSVTSNAICAIPDTNSQTITVSVSPMQSPSVNVSVLPGDVVCEGAPVVFTGSSLYGGARPEYEWIVNSAFVGSGLSYSYVPATGDIVMLRMVSDYPCRLADTVFSNTNIMEVDQRVVPSVNISVNPGIQISEGETVTFTATVTNGGYTPAYQWWIDNNEIAGATNSSYTTSNISDNDSVSCVVTGGCDLQSFNSVRMTVTNEGVQQVNESAGDITLVPNPNHGAFTVKGKLTNVTDQEVSLQVVDMLGQIVHSQTATVHDGIINETVQLGSNLANGMYILNMRTGAQISVLHFVVEQ